MNIKKIVRKYFIVIPFLLYFSLVILPLFKPGLIVGGDWALPYTVGQLKEYSASSMSIWSNREIPTGTQVSYQNAYLNNFLAGIFGNLDINGIIFQKATLFLTLTGMYVFSYFLFSQLTKNKFASSIASLAYGLSPLVFNYVNMGWNYVLFFLALAPLFMLVSINYFKSGGFRRLITLGLICALGFIQAQAIVWFPILYFLIFIYSIEQSNVGDRINKLFFGILSMAIITIAVHAPWVISNLNSFDTSIKSTSSIDLNRFSVVFSIFRSFLGWGSLFNQQFEFSFPPILLLFAFFPIILIIYSSIYNNNKYFNKLFYLAISLILIAPLIYIFRLEISKIPFSTIIRDSSRFLVISSLGLSLGIALSISVIKNKSIIAFVLLGLAFSIYPSISGKMYKVSNSYGIPFFGQDFRLRFLKINMDNFDQLLSTYSGQTNLFFPAGGTIQTKNDVLFKEDFWGIPDIQAFFSPYASGIYKSDKSNTLVSNFVDTLKFSENDLGKIKKILGIYGVNNIINRANLSSFISISSDEIRLDRQCKKIDNPDSDLSITDICHINNAYPIIYSSTSPIYSTESIQNIIFSLSSNEKLSMVGCPNSIEMTGMACGPAKPYTFKTGNQPEIRTTSLSTTQYIVDITNVNGPFLLVLNKTFHPGWRILDTKGTVLNFDHILINQLVNGWYINPSSETSSLKYIIDYHPQDIYSKILPFSAIFSVSITLFILLGLIKRNEKL